MTKQAETINKKLASLRTSITRANGKMTESEACNIDMQIENLHTMMLKLETKG